MAVLNGVCDRRFDAVRGALERNLDSGGGGWGGSVVIMDTGRRMTVSYMMNKMGPGIVGSERSTEYCTAIYQAVTG